MDVVFYVGAVEACDDDEAVALDFAVDGYAVLVGCDGYGEVGCAWTGKIFGSDLPDLVLGESELVDGDVYGHLFDFLHHRNGFLGFRAIPQHFLSHSYLDEFAIRLCYLGVACRESGGGCECPHEGGCGSDGAAGSWDGYCSAGCEG